MYGTQFKLGALVAKHLADTCAPDKEVVLAGKPDGPVILGNDGHELRVIAQEADASAENITQQLVTLQVIMVVDCMYPAQNDNYKLLFVALEAGVDYVDISNSPKAIDVYHQYKLMLHLQDTKSRCVLNCGMSPGVSNLIAASFLDDIEQTNDDKASVRVEFDFHYQNYLNVPYPLLPPGLSESAIMLEGRIIVSLPKLSGKTFVDFSPDMDERVVFNWTRCEVESIAHTYNVSNVHARMGFGTELSMLWIYVVSIVVCLSHIFGVIAFLCSIVLFISVLIIRNIVYCLCCGCCRRARKVNPHGFGMRIAVLGSDNVMQIHRQTHRDFSESAKDIAVLQIREVMQMRDNEEEEEGEDVVGHGVWFPEQAFVGETRTRIIERSMEIASFSDMHSYIHTRVGSDGAFNNHVKTNQSTLLVLILLYGLTILPCTILLVYVCQWEVTWAISFIIGLIWLLY